MGFQHLTPERRRELGRRGGYNNVKKNGRQHMSEIGEKGGLKLREERGVEFYRSISRKYQDDKRNGLVEDK